MDDANGNAVHATAPDAYKKTCDVQDTVRNQ